MGADTLRRPTARATRPKLEVADVIRHCAPDYLRDYAPQAAHERVLRHLAACRTAQLGGHVERCDRCGYERNAYNSCRDRHCPKCQASGSVRWVEARERDLLPVHYFHVVFTLPASIAAIALQNKRVVYGLLFQASSSVMTELAADPKHLGARLGFLGVLHTWGQTLTHHPHVHYVVAGGGPSLDGERWLPCRASYFLPIPVLQLKFRGRFLDLLKHAYAAGRLQFRGVLRRLARRKRFLKYLRTPYRQNWVVYAKPPFGSPQQVVRYLGRYTHRVAIGNSRLLDLRGGRISFRWKDYSQGSRQRVLTLEATEFLRRFLLHVLPKRFVRIRYYGFLANRWRVERLKLCRELLGVASKVETTTDEEEEAASEGEVVQAACPKCGEGRMLRAGLVAPVSPPNWRIAYAEGGAGLPEWSCDTS
ncbi:MAG: putative transposase y4qJ [Minwuia thermotolerans]|nr:MAG: putative transposase y4qJ [Minwuia thermotolerans]